MNGHENENGNGNAFKDKFSEELEDEGLKNFKVTVKNMITGQQIVTTQLNHYYQSPPSTSQPPTPLLNDNGTFNDPPNNNPTVDNFVKPTLNEIYAIKFLRSLERSVFVQSTVDDINKDLDGYGSKNTITVTTVHGNGNGRKRARANNHNSNDSSTDEDDEDDIDGPANGIPTNVPTGIKMTRIPWLTKQNGQTTTTMMTDDQTVKLNGDSLVGNGNNNNNSDANLTSNDRIEMHLHDEQQRQQQTEKEEESSTVNYNDDEDDADSDEDMESDSPKRHYPGSSRREGSDEERTVKRTKSVSNMKLKLHKDENSAGVGGGKGPDAETGV
ncbi:unnamed protein product [Ambrosiozyma monospora]|uniref:Unnamed protein product n=1 Tax=Ambrosiozyma monospora TaxID=43982 RepID=A0ACB5TJG0_AMBMO|nr:unnamed protein product [Ambrosiozyma monospora]